MIGMGDSLIAGIALAHGARMPVVILMRILRANGRKAVRLVMLRLQSF